MDRLLGHAQELQPRFDRVVETMLILKMAPPIDWSYLNKQAQKRWQRIPLLEVLQYLQDTLEIKLPEYSLQNLKRSTLYQTEKRAYNFNYQEAKGWRKGYALWFMHCQCQPDAKFPARLLSFTKFLQKKWQLNAAWQVPLHAFQVLLNRSRRSVSCHKKQQINWFYTWNQPSPFLSIRPKNQTKHMLFCCYAYAAASSRSYESPYPAL